MSNVHDDPSPQTEGLGYWYRVGDGYTTNFDTAAMWELIYSKPVEELGYGELSSEGTFTEREGP
jgi:hypothetical protein